MAAHSTQLGANQAVATSVVTLYTVPAGKRTIVKSLVVSNNFAGANYVTILGYDGSTLLFTFDVFGLTNGTDGDTKFLLPWIVLNAGQALKAQALHSSVSIVASGAELAA